MDSPPWRTILRDGVEYDLYANRLWLPFIASGASDDELAVFKHLLAASEIWITRVEGYSLSSMPDVPLTEDALQALRERWLKAIETCEFDQMIGYTNRKGISYSRSFGDIARHAMNHGTYHRGHLRGIFGSRGKEFPDTDYIGFAFDRDGQLFT